MLITAVVNLWETTANALETIAVVLQSHITIVHVETIEEIQNVPTIVIVTQRKPLHLQYLKVRPNLKTQAWQVFGRD